MDEQVKKKRIDFLYKIYKSVTPSKGFPVGTVREWNGNNYKKKINGDWQYIGEANKNREKSDNTAIKEEEEKAISDYSLHLFGQINGYLRGQINEQIDTETKEKLDKTINNIESGLDKLPSYNNEVLYRGIKESKTMQEVVQQYENIMNDEEAVIQYDSFLSTSKSEVVASIFGGSSEQTPVFFKINTQNENSDAKDIKDYAGVPREQEVLFNKESEFDVSNVDKTYSDQLGEYVEVTLNEL